MRGMIRYLSVLALACGVFGAETSSAQTQHTLQFDLPAQPLADALRAIGSQTNLNILIDSPLVAGRQAPALKAELTPGEAIAFLLKESGIEHEFLNDTTVVIEAPGTKKAGNSRGASGKPIANATQGSALRLTQADTSSNATGSSSSAPAQEAQETSDVRLDSKNEKIEEIVVTAGKRRESIQDVAASISAIGAQDIERKNLAGMSDYLRVMPGVNMIDMGPGRNAIFMRGIAADPQVESRTVGVYFGEIPVSVLSLENGAADFKMVDIERVEVLRGPQGTLYGSGSLGGTVRIIPKAPNLESLEGNVGGTYSYTDKKGSDNNELQGMLNVPLVGGQLAVRAAAYQYDNSGYVENISALAKAGVGPATGAVLLNKPEVGGDRTRGMRFSALWQPTAALRLNYLYAQQESDQDGRPEVNLEIGDYQQGRFSTIWGDEMQLDDVRAHNIVLEYDLGWASLVSSSAWVNQDGATNRNFLGTFFETLPVGQRTETDNKSFTQEVRLTSSLEGPVQYVVGLYYDDIDRSSTTYNAWNGDPALSEINGFGVNSIGVGDFFSDATTKQKSAFAEVTYQFTRRFALTAGARIFDYKIDSFDYTDGASFYTAGSVPVSNASSEDDTSYKVNLSFAPDEDKLFYAQWAQGFRLGRPLQVPPFCDVNNDRIHDNLGIPFPSQLNSDFLDNFELGAKLAFAGRRVIINSSVYRIQWDGIPVVVGVFSPCGTGVFSNAGSATSQGVEIEATFHPTNSVRLDLGGSYIDTELGTAFPGGEIGDRLPGSPKYNYNAGVQYDFELVGRATYVRSDYAYVGGFYNNFPQLGAEAGDYSQLNIKAGMDLANMSLAVFINNVLNEDALTWVDIFPPTASQMRPRTLGVRMQYRF